MAIYIVDLIKCKNFSLFIKKVGMEYKKNVSLPKRFYVLKVSFT